jgi:hypothetical protein
MAEKDEREDMTSRRLFLSSAAMCAGGLFCMGGDRAIATAQQPFVKSLKPQLVAADAKMTFKQVYDFAFNDYIQVLKVLENDIGREKFLPMLQNAASTTAAEQLKRNAPPPPKNTLAAFTSFDDQYFWSHVLARSIVENTEKAYEMRVTECLWSETFRAAGAADIGYATICHPDYAMASAFNPKIRMVRTKTLMQGQDCCNHRWVLDD